MSLPTDLPISAIIYNGEGVPLAVDWGNVINKPTIPTVDDELNDTSENPVQNKVIKSAFDGKANADHTHITADVTGLDSQIETITEIANGKCKAYVFNTVDEMNTWLGSSENTAPLKTGDVLLIRAVNVPDYWWDGSSAQILETTKVEVLTESDVEDIVNPLLDNKVDKVTGKGLSTNDYTTEEKTKLSGIAAGAEVNVNADWNATSGKAQILNKPTIPSSLPANGGNADTVDGYHIRTTTDENDTGLAGYITFVI